MCVSTHLRMPPLFLCLRSLSLRRTIQRRSPECSVYTVPFCLRVSGAVAPSATIASFSRYISKDITKALNFQEFWSRRYPLKNKTIQKRQVCPAFLIQNLTRHVFRATETLGFLLYD